MIHQARSQVRNANRPAFTLVELLVVMGVLALMSSMVLVGLASAAEQARAARTRSQIQKIHELLMTRWEDYRYRRVEINRTGNVRARQTLRLDRIREIMRMEMPCHVEDLRYDSTTMPAGSTVASLERYRRTVAQRATQGNPPTDGTWFDAQDYSDGDGWTTTHEGAECLYMILESIQDGETNGLDFFKSSEFADTDGDGLPEILDAWGKPLLFLRWAPGFIGPRSNLQVRDQPDPFDPLNVRNGRDPSTVAGEFVHFPLYPLVMSAGPDEAFDIASRFGDDDVMAAQINPWLNNSDSFKVPNDPYISTSSNIQLGAEMDVNGNGKEEFHDNVSNHNLLIPGNS